MASSRGKRNVKQVNFLQSQSISLMPCVLHDVLTGGTDRICVAFCVIVRLRLIAVQDWSL
jgi:hypothetical protein